MSFIIILLNVFETVWLDDTAAEQEYVRVHIGQGPEPVVVLLAGCVVQVELHQMVAFI